VSPKLEHAGMPRHTRIVPEVLGRFVSTGKAEFKFVCRTTEDVDDVAALTVDLDIPRHLVWIMPEGMSREVLDLVTGNIVERVLHYRFNFTPRLHVMLWANQRGH
jgi:hypothetical protein